MSKEASLRHFHLFGAIEEFDLRVRRHLNHALLINFATFF